MRNLRAIDIVYKNAPDSQKVWIETTDRYWLKGGLKSFEKSLANHVELSKSLADSILEKLPKKPKVIVDIGAGYGGVAINLALAGIRVATVEPGRGEHRVMQYFLGKYPKAKKYVTVVDGVAEKLPFAKDCADLCILSQVLEHVQDPKKAMAEIARVLKPGCYLHLSCPNYLFPAEQHYHLPYFPLMPKRLFSSWALYLLRTLNIKNIKNPGERDFSIVHGFINTVNYTTDKVVRELCLENNLNIIWSFKENLGFVDQLRLHFSRNPTFANVIMVTISSPIKLLRSFLVPIGLLPMKLEYLIQKPSVKARVKQIN